MTPFGRWTDRSRDPSSSPLSSRMLERGGYNFTEDSEVRGDRGGGGEGEIVSVSTSFLVPCSVLVVDLSPSMASQ